MIKCLEKKRLTRRNPCLDCSKRISSCRMKQELIDSNIFLSVYLEERDRAINSTIINKNNKRYIGYISTIQVSHILRKFSDKIKKAERERNVELSNKLKVNVDNCRIKLQEFYIIDFEEKDLTPLRELQNDLSLRIEFHDKMNMAIAISNKLNVQTTDKDLIGDSQNIANIAQPFGHKFRMNGEI